MDRTKTFFFYDLETFGLESSYDRIAQFAGIRTDLNFNIIGDEIVLYSKPPMDYLPHPDSCLLTGITPQIAMEKGIPESEFAERIFNEFSKPGTCVLGFNSINFDDEMMRNAFYRNLMDPYVREYANDCSRWDIINLVRAVHDLRPEGINWPHDAEGFPVFRLTDLTAANGIEQIGAHDAMVDVYATIAVAKLIKEKQPKMFDFYFKNRSKTAVKNFVGSVLPEPVLYTCPKFRSTRGNTSVIAALTPVGDRTSNKVICFDLMCDPSPLLNADADSILNVPGVFKLTINKCPALAPLNALRKEDEVRLGIDKKLAEERYMNLKSRQMSLTLGLRGAVQNEEPFASVNDVDFKMYDALFSEADKQLFAVIRKTPKTSRLAMGASAKVSDPRFRELLFRHIGRNYPETMDSETAGRWKAYCLSRLMCPPGDKSVSFSSYEQLIAERLSNPELDEKGRRILKDLSDYGDELKKKLGI